MTNVNKKKRNNIWKKKKLKDKAAQYAQVVKELYLPKINREKIAFSKENIRDVVMKAAQAEEYNEEAFERPYRLKPKHILQSSLPIRKSKERSQSPRFSDSEVRVQDSVEKQDTSESNQMTPSPERNVKSESKKMYSRSRLGDKSPNDLQSETYMDIRDTYKPLESFSSNPVRTSKNNLKNKTFKNSDDEQEALRVVTEEAKYPNYIAEIRQKRLVLERQGIKVRKTNWEKHLKDDKLTYKEKVETVLNDAKLLEMRAKRKEDMHRKIRNADDVLEDEDIDDCYVESIKAKIAVLEKWKET